MRYLMFKIAVNIFLEDSIASLTCPRLNGAIAYKFILLRSDPHGGRVKIHSIQFQMHSIKA